MQSFQHATELPVITIISATLNILPHIAIPHNVVHNLLQSFLLSLLGYLSSAIPNNSSPVNGPFIQGSATVVVESLLGLTIEALTKVGQLAAADGAKALSNLWESVVLDALTKYGRNIVVLRGALAYLEAIRPRYVLVLIMAIILNIGRKHVLFYHSRYQRY